MQLEPWVPPCIFFGWWFRPWELWGEEGLVCWYCCSFYGVANSFSSFSPSPTSSIGVLCSVSWLAASICICIGQALAEPLRGQLLGISKSVCNGMDPQVGQSLDGLSFSLCSIFCPCFSIGKENFWNENFEMSGWPHPSLNCGLWQAVNFMSQICSSFTKRFPVYGFCSLVFFLNVYKFKL